MPNTFVISVVSTKGGIGKTTLAANIAGLLADMGFKVLAVDADMQPSLTKCFRLKSIPVSGLSDVIARGGMIRATDFVPTDIDNLDVLVSNMTDATQSWLKEREDRLILLKRAMRQPVIRDKYDYVVIDTQGAKGELQRAAAMAADLLLSPLRPSMMEYVEFHSGTMEMLSSLNVMSDISPELRAAQLAVVINAADRTRSSKLIQEQIRIDFRSNQSVRLLDTVVPDTKAYAEARMMNQPVHRTDPDRKDRVAPSGYTVMHEMIFELLPNLKGLWVGGEDHSEGDKT